MISPRILPTNFTSGKEISSYEFYNPSIVARQLGFGQVPPFPIFAGKVQFRGTIGNALSYDRLKDLEPSVDMALLADWQITSFVTTPFTQWWSEWQEHLFCRAVNLYCTVLNNNYQTCENEVQTKSTFTTFLSIFCLHLLIITPSKMMIKILQQSTEAVIRSTILCRPINLTSATTLHLLQMSLGENTNYRLPR